MSIGLMGFGRIGRNVFRLLADDPLEISAIADIADPAALAYLLKYDSIYGRFGKEVELDGSTLVIDGVRIPILEAREPGDIDWAGLGVSSVIQATGKIPYRRLGPAAPRSWSQTGNPRLDTGRSCKHADHADRDQRRGIHS